MPLGEIQGELPGRKGGGLESSSMHVLLGGPLGISQSPWVPQEVRPHLSSSEHTFPGGSEGGGRHWPRQGAGWLGFPFQSQSPPLPLPRGLTFSVVICIYWSGKDWLRISGDALLKGTYSLARGWADTQAHSSARECGSEPQTHMTTQPQRGDGCCPSGDGPGTQP